MYHSNLTRNNEDNSRVFARLMFQGKVKAALRMLMDNSRGSFLPLSAPVGDSTVLDELVKKHPPPSRVVPDALVDPDGPLPDCSHPIIFECLDEHVIRSAVLHVDGAAGPSGLDAHSWRRLCTSFHNASTDLCRSLALVARKIATSFVDPEALQPLLNNRLIALDKNPGVRPIGIGEVSRRLIAKSILGLRPLCWHNFWHNRHAKALGIMLA